MCGTVIPHICANLAESAGHQGEKGRVAGACGYRYSPAMARVPDRTGERINLTLPQEAARVLDRVARSSGVGRATFVREWLMQCLPQLDQLASAMELAQRGNVDAITVALGAVRDAMQVGDQVELQLKQAKRRAFMRKKKLVS